MIIPVCVGHLSNWAIRVGRARHSSECLGCDHTCTFYVSDQPLPGMHPIAVGRSAEGPYSGEWRHSMLKGANGNGPGWSHEFVFYAYLSPVPGTIPYAVGHAANETGNWKYRISENSTSAGDKGWTHDFVFYAMNYNPNSMMPVCVGYNDNGWTYKVQKGVVCQAHPFKHLIAFQALSEPVPDSFPVAVGYVNDYTGHRSRITEGHNAGSNGWTHEFVMYMFREQKPGTIPVAIGHADSASGGLKYKLGSGTEAGGNGWTHDFIGYVFPQNGQQTPPHQPPVKRGIIPVAVGYESTYWASLVLRTEAIQEYGFKQAFTFYAHDSNVPGTKPFSVGDVGSPGNQHRSQIANGRNAGGNGWRHNFTFYAFDQQRPRTTVFAVGHANCELGGWKYRIVQRPNAGGDGWSHDFTFYAYSKR